MLFFFFTKVIFAKFRSFGEGKKVENFEKDSELRSLSEIIQRTNAGFFFFLGDDVTSSDRSEEREREGEGGLSTRMRTLSA